MSSFDFEAANRAIFLGSLLGRADTVSPRGSVALVGQPEARRMIEPFLIQEHFPATLITGEPGIGKTHLARWIAAERQAPYVELICPVNPARVPDEGIVLLDEIHNIRQPEWLYPMMDSVTVTILGATTRPESLDAALVSRFFLRVQMRRYDHGSMIEMLKLFAPQLGQHENEQWLAALAGAGAGNPRQLKRIIKTAEGLGTFDPAVVLPAAQITADGLTGTHLDYLATLAKVRRAIGIEAVARMMFVDQGTILQAERLLVEYGLVELTPSGRKISPKGSAYLTRATQTEEEH